jgi:hypothetical protein
LCFVLGICNEEYRAEKFDKRDPPCQEPKTGKGKAR